MAISGDLLKKLDKLKKLLRGYKKLAVAFSGGVDSTFLLKVATEVLGNNVIAIYVDSPLQPQREKEAVKQLIRSLGAEMDILAVDELSHSAFQNNPPDRCYYCKGLIFGNIIEVAHLKGISIIVDGSNYDDTHDYRPGMKALKEHKIKSPLLEAGLSKEEIRILSKEFGLPTWDKDALACLATRIPFGEAITKDKLMMVDKAEEYLTKSGFRNVRARYLGDTVLIEVREDQVLRLRNNKFYKKLEQRMNNIGFSKIEIATEGYKQGRMNPK
jgi:pyridinium-3,5-biscarboxylic acid mononucleotide sulfurtransferase